MLFVHCKYYRLSYLLCTLPKSNNMTTNKQVPYETMQHPQNRILSWTWSYGCAGLICYQCSQNQVPVIRRLSNYPLGDSLKCDRWHLIQKLPIKGQSSSVKSSWTQYKNQSGDEEGGTVEQISSLVLRICVHL